MTLQKTLLLVGIAILSFATLGMLYQEAMMVMLFTFFIPGPAFGLVISIFKKSTILQRLLFLLATCVVYISTLYMIDVNNIDYKLSPLRILLASVISASLLQLLFDLIFRSAITYKNTFLLPAILGFTSSFVTTIAIFFLKMVKPPTGLITITIWLGIFSIFPLWYCLFGRHLIKTGKICN